MVKPSLNLVVLRVADLGRAEGFYSALGCVFVRERHGSGPEHLAASVGGATLELYPLKTHAPLTDVRGSDPAADGTRSVPATLANLRIGFVVASVDEVLAAVEKFGGTIKAPAADSAWGRRAVVIDPDGHVVEIAERRTSEPRT